ncbi:MAG: hypothetical protein J3K34DRAFT_441455 [Monoraphidium minutum]|nr:MAG: hypothetical protein J3K34DRAFT_441455 [Monoraphidium minutum]
MRPRRAPALMEALKSRCQVSSLSMNQVQVVAGVVMTAIGPSVASPSWRVAGQCTLTPPSNSCVSPEPTLAMEKHRLQELTERARAARRGVQRARLVPILHQGVVDVGAHAQRDAERRPVAQAERRQPRPGGGERVTVAGAVVAVDLCVELVAGFGQHVEGEAVALGAERGTAELVGLSVEAHQVKIAVAAAVADKRGGGERPGGGAPGRELGGADHAFADVRWVCRAVHGAVAALQVGHRQEAIGGDGRPGERVGTVLEVVVGHCGVSCCPRGRTRSE